VNYSPFLKKRSNLKFTNHYKLHSKKKNGRIFLLSSVISITAMTTLVSFLANSDSFATTQQPDDSDQQVASLELPEVRYQSQLLSKASKTVVYTEDETVLESVDVEITPEVNNNTSVSNINISLPEDAVSDINNDLAQKLLADDSQDNARQEPAPKNTVANISLDQAPAITINDPDTESLNGTQEKPLNIKTIIVKKGDTLSAIFKRQSLSSSTLYKIINSGKQAKSLTRIKPGQKFTIALNDKNEIESLTFALNKVDTLTIAKQDKQFVSHIDSKDIEIRQQFTTATINNSLFSAGQKAGLNSSMIMKLAHIFGWDIDFALDIRKGDSFAVLFEEKFVDGKKIGSGNILSAEFVNNGKVFNAIRYTDTSGHTDYYSENGLSMRKAFLRTPVEFSRISSRFTTARKHPVLNRIRAHKGVDYAASRGTPIKAVGDGKVVFKGRKGGYGRVIILQHGSKYTTLYAHMNSYNKKLRNGSRVKQGQTIGYIGSSGLATGPHLHYEFRVNGVHRNPLTVKLPSAAPIAKKYRSDFKATAETLISQLTLRKQETIALNE